MNFPLVTIPFLPHLLIFPFFFFFFLSLLFISSMNDSACGCADERLKESAAMIANYPDRIPVVVERFSRSNLPEMEKRKYLVPCDMPVGQFIFILRCRLHLTPGTALFVFVNNTLPQTANLMGSVYESYKDEDGFLYMCYSSEKTFG